MKKSLIVLFVIVVSNFLYSQSMQNISFLPQSNNFNLSFIQNDNIQINHSISCMTAVSNNYSFYQSMYTNHINYRFNDKLDLKINLNFVNNGTFEFNNYDIKGNKDNKTELLPEFQLDYSPTDNIHIRVEYKRTNQFNSRRNSYFGY